jgi:ribosome-associated heat shock protein Hsp15
MKSEVLKVRLDKFLWAIRVFKTRSLAADFCNSGKVKLNNQYSLKASHSVKPGEQYHIRVEKDYIRIIEVVNLIEKRQAYSVVKDFYLEHSLPREKKDVLPSVFVLPQATREKGSGRPTKKDRRKLGDTGFLD